jgi:hypothetical protein
MVRGGDDHEKRGRRCRGVNPDFLDWDSAVGKECLRGGKIRAVERARLHDLRGTGKDRFYPEKDRWDREV